MSDVIQEHQELKQSTIIVDPRSITKKIWDGLDKPWIPLVWAVISTLTIAVLPAFVMPAIFVQGVLWLAVVSKPDVLPIHLPLEADKVDRNDPKPGDNNGFYKARGSFFIGRIKGTGVELWVSFKALTQHFLLFGTTGSGKTESIVSYIVNYLSVGSGVAFNDAKAAPKAMIQMATICRIFARDDDYRVTNYIKGNTSARRDPAERASNDAAVFARGSAESNTQLLVSLMPPSKGENQIFAERAIALVAATMPALTDLRDLGIIQIDPSIIRKYMGFQQFADLFTSNNISKRSRDALEAYLLSLPGYDPKKEVATQPEEVARQFGFAQAYFTRSLSSLSDTYGYIYLVGQGEIDYQDAVLNGRILMTLLPSMEKSGEELSNLGKIVLSATRNGMVVGLGTVFEGSVEDIALNLPTNSDIPYGIQNDENAYMLVEGQEMFNAQARGLGFSILTGTQDVSGMLLSIEKTTKQIMANSAFKQFMFLDDEDTTKLAVELSGEALVLERGRYDMVGDMGSFYASSEAAVQKRYRLNGTALKKRGLGQAYLLYQGKMHDVQVFNHGINETDKNPLFAWISHWYSVRMPKVRIPTEEVLNDLLALSPRPEWRDLKIMINDTSRAMLREMTTYFASMIAINRMMDHYNDNPGLKALAGDVFGSRDLITAQPEMPIGLIKEVVDNAPSSFRDTFALLSKIAASHESANSKLASMADRAGLDSVQLNLPNQVPPPFVEDSGSASGSSGSSGGGGSSQPSLNTQIDLLADWLDDGGAVAPAPTPTPAPALLPASVPAPVSVPANAPIDDALFPDTDFGEPPSYLLEDMPGTSSYAYEMQDDEPEERYEPVPNKSSIGEAVERNLGNMPWMASAVEYEAVVEALTQTELYFEASHETAASNVADGFEELGKQLIYPESQMPPTDPARIVDIIKGFARRSNPGSPT